MVKYQCVAISVPQEDSQAYADNIQAYGKLVAEQAKAGWSLLMVRPVQTRHAVTDAPMQLDVVVFVSGADYDVAAINGPEDLPEDQLPALSAAMSSAVKAAAGVAPAQPSAAPVSPTPHAARTAAAAEAVSAAVAAAQPRPVSARPRAVAEDRSPTAPLPDLDDREPPRFNRTLLLGIAAGVVAILAVILVIALIRSLRTGKADKDVGSTSGLSGSYSLELGGADAEASADEAGAQTPDSRSGQLGSLYYTIEEDRAVITSWDSAGGAVAEIPSAIEDVPVTGIEAYAFYGRKLLAVSVPNTVTEIGEDAFGDNPYLTLIAPGCGAAIEYARAREIPMADTLEDSPLRRVSVLPGDLYAEATEYVVTAEEFLNLRAGPDTSYDKLEELAAKDRVTGIAANGDWLFLLNEDGDQYGWASVNYLTEAGEYDAGTWTYANDWFSLDLPNSWERTVDIAEHNQETTFNFTGRDVSVKLSLFSLLVCTDKQDYQDLSDSTLLMEQDGYYFVAVYPREDAAGNVDEEIAEVYDRTYQQIPEVLDTLKPGELSPLVKDFDTWFAGNPLDAAYARAKAAAADSDALAKATETFAQRWHAEVLWAYQMLMSSAEGDTHDQVMDDYDDWNANSDTLLAEASSGSANSTQLAYEFYRTKAESLYRLLFSIKGTDYAYCYSG